MHDRQTLQTIGKYRPFCEDSSDAEAPFERSEFADTSENKRRNKMGDIDVFAMAVCHVQQLQIKILSCAI